MAVTSPGPGLVTGLVTAGPVTQKVEASGTVAPHGEATVSFATSGTVAAVEVKPGQAVAAGQTLATLQTAGLQSQVDSANASVASAEQKLQDDENAETSAAAAASSSAAEATSGAATTDSVSETSFDTVNLTAVIAASSPAPEVSGGSPDPGGSDLVSQIKAAQQTLITAQQKVDQGQTAVDQAQSAIDADIIQNTALRNAQVTACSTGTSASSAPDPSSSATASTSSGLSAQCASAEADYEAYADTLNSAGNGLDAAITAQDAAVKALDQAISGLDSLLDLLPASIGSGSSASPSPSATRTPAPSPSPSATRTPAPSPRPSGTRTPAGGTPRPTTSSGGAGETGGSRPSGTSSSGSGAGGSGSSSQAASAPASASQLAADQAEIDAAKAQLAVAKQGLAAATLKSPIVGTIAAVGFTAGSSSSGSSVTILGTGGQVVNINVPLSEISQLKTGQPASVQADGVTVPVHGTVSYIGLLSSTSGSLTTFPVVIALNEGSPALHDGVGADVTVTTGGAANAVLVPNSAITTIGTRHVVTVVANGKGQVTAVTLGLAGTDVSQVTAGLKVGQAVELANPGTALPSSATSSSTITRFPAGFGGGFVPGGFGGGTTRSGGGARTAAGG
jgi:multidrug efflux pump subunit AcrA (membrane-fusion protein)